MEVQEPKDRSGSEATLEVRLNGPPCRPVSVDFATAGRSAATEGKDYKPTSGEILFDEKDVEKRVVSKTIR